MLDGNWVLINGPDAHEIEVLNYANQVNVIDAMVRLFVHHMGGSPDGIAPPNNLALRELHRTGTLFLLHKPGEWRECQVTVGAHTPPDWEKVPALMDDFATELGARWTTFNAVTAAAFTLWRVNWIHPFKNGNGRTARAFAYACMCIKAGAFLPGQPTVIDLVMANRPPFVEALRQADQTFEATGTPDLDMLEAFLEGLLRQQLAQVVPGADASA